MLIKHFTVLLINSNKLINILFHIFLFSTFANMIKCHNSQYLLLKKRSITFAKPFESIQISSIYCVKQFGGREGLTKTRSICRKSSTKRKWGNEMAILLRIINGFQFLLLILLSYFYLYIKVKYFFLINSFLKLL